MVFVVVEDLEVRSSTSRFALVRYFVGSAHSALVVAEGARPVWDDVGLLFFLELVTKSLVRFSHVLVSSC